MEFALVYGAFGLIIGSFLNVFVLRSGVRSLHGRSACMSCGKTLAWFDLIPVFSYIALRGRCRVCGASISFQYPLVELLTACLFGAVGFASLSPLQTVLALAIIFFLIAIAVYDTRHTIIPDTWALSFGVLALVYVFVGLVPQIHMRDTLTILISGPLSALPLFTLWFVSSGRWMGLGDAKLALGIGWLLGPVYGLASVFFAFVVGAIVGVALIAGSLLRTKTVITHKTASSNEGAGFTMKSEIPFGPFLVFSCITLWLLTLHHIDPLLAPGLL